MPEVVMPDATKLLGIARLFTTLSGSLMKTFYLLAALLFLFIACPALAFTADNLDIAVSDTADAVITFEYELTWAENAAVFMRITDPSLELKRALESNYKKTVDVVGTDNGHAQFIVHDFATIRKSEGGTVMSTPALSFVNAEKVLKQYWFAPFVNPDFSPSITRVSFPDGYSYEFDNQISIPALRHTLIVQP